MLKYKYFASANALVLYMYVHEWAIILKSLQMCPSAKSNTKRNYLGGDDRRCMRWFCLEKTNRQNIGESFNDYSSW